MRNRMTRFIFRRATWLMIFEKITATSYQQDILVGSLPNSIIINLSTFQALEKTGEEC